MMTNGDRLTGTELLFANGQNAAVLAPRMAVLVSIRQALCSRIISGDE